MLTQLEAAKNTLFDRDALDVADIKIHPGSSRDATAEQMAEQVNKIVAQLMAGDYDDLTACSND